MDGDDNNQVDNRYFRTAPMGRYFLDRTFGFNRINEKIAEMNGLSVSMVAETFYQEGNHGIFLAQFY